MYFMNVHLPNHYRILVKGGKMYCLSSSLYCDLRTKLLQIALPTEWRYEQVVLQIMTNMFMRQGKVLL